MFRAIRRFVRSLPKDPGERFLMTLAAVSLAFGIFTLVAVTGVESYRHEPRVGVIVGEGLAKRRELSGFRWRRVTAATPLYRRDTIRTGSGEITVQFENGRLVAIPPGTTVRIDELLSSQVALSLLGGQMAASDSVLLKTETKRLPSGDGALLAVPRLPVPHTLVPR